MMKMFQCGEIRTLKPVSVSPLISCNHKLNENLNFDLNPSGALITPLTTAAAMARLIAGSH